MARKIAPNSKNSQIGGGKRLKDVGRKTTFWQGKRPKRKIAKGNFLMITADSVIQISSIQEQIKHYTNAISESASYALCINLASLPPVHNFSQQNKASITNSLLNIQTNSAGNWISLYKELVDLPSTITGGVAINTLMHDVDFGVQRILKGKIEFKDELINSMEQLKGVMNETKKNVIQTNEKAKEVHQYFINDQEQICNIVSLIEDERKVDNKAIEDLRESIKNLQHEIDLLNIAQKAAVGSIIVGAILLPVGIVLGAYGLVELGNPYVVTAGVGTVIVGVVLIVGGTAVLYNLPGIIKSHVDQIEINKKTIGDKQEDIVSLLGFESLMNQFKERAGKAVKALEIIEKALSNVEAAIEKDIDILNNAEEFKNEDLSQLSVNWSNFKKKFGDLKDIAEQVKNSQIVWEDMKGNKYKLTENKPQASDIKFLALNHPNVPYKAA